MARGLTSIALAGFLAACADVPVAPFGVPASVDLNASVPHQMTPAEVRDVVLEKIAQDTARAQLPEAVPTKELIITSLAPRQSYEVLGGSFVNETVTWAVEFEGVALSCGRDCEAFTAGTWIVDDTTRGITGGAFSGRVPCPGC